MRIYETTFIVNPQSDDAFIDQQATAVTGLITGNGGKILRENRIGTRRLAYMIDGLTQGYYTNIIFEAPSSVLPLMDRHFKLEEPYVRYLTIRYETEMPAEDEDEHEHHAAPPAARPRPARVERRAEPAAAGEDEAEAEETKAAEAETPAESETAAEPETPAESAPATEPASEAAEPEKTKEPAPPAPEEPPAASDEDEEIL